MELWNKKKKINQQQMSPIMRMSISVYIGIKDFIGNHRAERGGMLGRDRNGLITHFEPDHNGHCNTVTYDPDIPHMNKVIDEWRAVNITFCGFVHSHPYGVRSPSSHDHWYAGKILNNFKKLSELWLPIVQTKPDTGNFELVGYAAIPGIRKRSSCSVVDAKIDVVWKTINANSIQKSKINSGLLSENYSPRRTASRHKSHLYGYSQPRVAAITHRTTEPHVSNSSTQAKCIDSGPCECPCTGGHNPKLHLKPTQSQHRTYSNYQCKQHEDNLIKETQA